MKKFLYYILITLIALGAFLTVFGDDPDLSAASSEETLVIAHRGGKGLWPENTLYAFHRAVELGVDVLEMDIRSTSDGVIVVIHDEDLSRTTNGAGPVNEINLSELKTLDAGHNWTSDKGQTHPYRGQGVTVPTLSEVFEAFPNEPLNIEIKQVTPDIVQPVADLIRKHNGAGRVTVASFDADTLKRFRKSFPEVSTSATATEVTISYVLTQLRLGSFYVPSANLLQIPEYAGKRQIASPRFVRTTQMNGLEIHVWTINKPEAMERLLSIGVDGIMTDYPDRLLALLRR